ncbi:type II toxin-antitoxin system Phd/YefM family antitoxin [Sphingomonas sp. DG1-23]|uniref:type II toxin-antitoxin system Phd/YefM family antitoxin n=1 Tax=Sphingomonas sp. DG1-23 TaxID=3068316 RepID=UPI00273FA149|nr:type II toxin-antitoxin system Phd/YefM family antitoxin [Sphingomonas sp. DG1-23]MDP5279149.1 type II toxin-antitoxin system Phd/YefM family antitoxin [Sphingomonas sp. DG1-23]
MTIVNVHDAKTHLSRLLARVAAGEEVVIGKSGKPVAKLVPIDPERPSQRQPGMFKGRIRFDDASFFEPLPGDELKLWEGR